MSDIETATEQPVIIGTERTRSVANRNLDTAQLMEAEDQAVPCGVACHHEEEVEEEAEMACCVACHLLAEEEACRSKGRATGSTGLHNPMACSEHPDRPSKEGEGSSTFVSGPAATHTM